MWRLAEFAYDEGIDAVEVSVLDDSLGSELVHMTRAEAIERAHEQGLNLVAWWPGDDSCVFSKVTLPVRWEAAPLPAAPPEPDEHLWFEASCGGRDFLLDSNGHTFRGRMSAWCPEKQVAYNVSLDEMGDMSTESRYFIRGFLAGNEPDAPEDDDGDIAPEDLTAWFAAVERFRLTGSWYGRWGTCSVCGCVLLPDSASERCHEHEGR